MTAKKIKVGQIWRTRDGSTVLVKSCDGTSYPFNLSPRSCVTREGREFDDGKTGGLDLVKLVRETGREDA